MFSANAPCCGALKAVASKATPASVEHSIPTPALSSPTTPEDAHAVWKACLISHAQSSCAAELSSVAVPGGGSRECSDYVYNDKTCTPAFQSFISEYTWAHIGADQCRDATASYDCQNLALYIYGSADGDVELNGVVLPRNYEIAGIQSKVSWNREQTHMNEARRIYAASTCRLAEETGSCDMLRTVLTEPDLPSADRQSLGAILMASASAIEERRWQSASVASCRSPTQSYDCRGVESYLGGYPNGKHAKEASALLAATRQRRQQLANQEAAAYSSPEAVSQRADAQRRKACEDACPKCSVAEADIGSPCDRNWKFCVAQCQK